MGLPSFRQGDDPGPNFAELLRLGGVDPFASLTAGPGVLPDLTHGTTVVALRCEGGVVMAGDRRATSGNFISHRDMEKVFPADSHSGIAIAGAAGPAVEMVRVFQLQLEHYEKVQGRLLSLEGKANQLSQFVRANLPAAMQGMVVVPIFAGYDFAQERGRLFQFDVTGGRYEERDYAASGSGSMHAGTVIKLGHSDDQSADDAAMLAVQALWHAADEDSATGGPDPIRGIYPIIATIDESGWKRTEDDDVATVFEQIREGLS